MASILDKYGIKEVCDFTFYKLENGKPTYPVLYLDTLKVSTMEQTGDTTEAKGGKGNVDLISWDYNKQLTVNIEDALFSAKSMAIMFGNGTVKTIKTEDGAQNLIMKSEVFTLDKAITKGAAFTTTVAKDAGWKEKFTAPDGRTANKINPKFYTADGQVLSGSASTSNPALAVGDKVFCSYDLRIEGSVIDITADSFPGTYYCTGDTYARSSADGNDEFFQLIFPKAKVQAGNTITMQADGDPSTFKMDLKILRPDDGVMVRLVKYDLLNLDNAAEESSTVDDLIHNHSLNEVTTNGKATSSEK